MADDTTNDLRAALDAACEAMPDRIRRAASSAWGGLVYLGDEDAPRWLYIPDADAHRLMIQQASDVVLGWCYAEAARRGLCLVVFGPLDDGGYHTGVCRSDVGAPPPELQCDHTTSPAVAALRALARAAGG